MYYGNLVSSRKTLPVFYEDMKQDPVFEMQKVASFLNQTDVDYEDKLDCLFGESSKKFKRSSDRGYDPYTYVDIATGFEIFVFFKLGGLYFLSNSDITNEFLRKLILIFLSKILYTVFFDTCSKSSFMKILTTVIGHWI